MLLSVCGSVSAEVVSRGEVQWTIHEDGSRELRDGDVVIVFPGLGEIRRLSTCGIEGSVSIRYVPDPITANVVRSRQLSCHDGEGGTARCTLSEALAYYDQDPDAYFELRDIRPEEAFAVARAFRSGAYTAGEAPAVRWHEMRITSLAKVASRHYAVGVADCGCAGKLLISSDSPDRPERLVVVDSGVLCR